MEVLYTLIPLALAFAAGGVIVFLNAVKKGQFDDLETPAHRMLLEDDTIPQACDKVSQNENKKTL